MNSESSPDEDAESSVGRDGSVDALRNGSIQDGEEHTPSQESIESERASLATGEMDERDGRHSPGPATSSNGLERLSRDKQLLVYEVSRKIKRLVTEEILDALLDFQDCCNDDTLAFVRSELQSSDLKDSSTLQVHLNLISEDKSRAFIELELGKLDRGFLLRV